MTDILKWIGTFIVKVLPGQGVRTIVIVLAQITYAVVSLANGTMTVEQAVAQIGLAIGLLTASNHKP